MKTILFLLLNSVCLMACTQSSVDELLGPYRWKHRLVLTFSPSYESAKLQTQKAVYETEGWEDRNLLFIHFTPNGGESQDGQKISTSLAREAYRSYGIEGDSFAVLLIGKDGGEKLRKQEEIITQEELFAIIDAMPMRRMEMREKDPD